MDTPFLITVLILVVFGLIMLFSASYATALYRFGDSFHYIKDQAIFAIIGVTAMLIASKVDYHIFHRLAWPLMAISMILLVVVLFMPAYNNAHRWITIKGLGTLQPSEIAKFTIIVLFAHIISVNYAKMKTFSYGVIPFMMVLAPVVVLMLLEPHLSGTILILSIGAIMMFVGGTSLKWFGLGGGVAVGGLAAALIAFPDLVPYAMTRIEMWQNPYLDVQGKGHQTIQSLLAIGSGGVMGLGLGNSRQKHLYVPEPQNDFIFSIICEELGFIGAMVVILLFVLLLVRGAVIAI
ncbi:MAG TPA: FtsW/RodA/SpoVE family cell cycle protein, partial [Candidatus Pygmaiobacter gallistercoris]|nr:FtsW/RodA/SpoVE family cell cycle protein [Candidatus Pygmaiobacter gallistercoris]